MYLYLEQKGKFHSAAEFKAMQIKVLLFLFKSWYTARVGKQQTSSFSTCQLDLLDAHLWNTSDTISMMSESVHKNSEQWNDKKLSLSQKKHT